MIRSLLLIQSLAAADSNVSNPEHALRGTGIHIQTQDSPAPIPQQAERFEAVVLHVPSSELKSYLHPRVKTPVLWWCDGPYPDTPPFQSEIEIDGMLCPQMSPAEYKWLLYLAVGHYRQREQLLLKLEERKWIEQAKEIICEIKHMNESEAYEFLRKQAMNERKKIVDVAISIVNVYRLLRKSK
ncbi:ANTAR domain-containing response regulator [Paenibacillus sp. MBLB4367]|uniref:ANTAR domain-containing response regulator n=1 Tax=Paenibacillus sp. MBLB4367 TaxID=3384767 RepID=UPI0039082CDD